MTAGARAASVTAALVVTVLAGGARANGAFPASDQVLWDPADPARLLLATSYGLVASADGGARWTWTCEAATFVEAGHPVLARLASGTVLGGLPVGAIRGHAGACAWERVADFGVSSVVDLTTTTPGRALALVVRGTDHPGEVWASDDDGRTFALVGAPLPVTLLPLTLDAAPSRPARLYVSGTSHEGDLPGVLARSDDGGATWETLRIDGASAATAPYVAAVDPEDEDVLWVRLDGAPGRLLRSTDAGEHFETVLETEGFLRAFALSPEGAEIVAGGEVDGLLRAPARTDGAWEPFLDVRARCARWIDDSLFVCGTEPADGFSLARWSAGAGLVPLYRQACLAGPEDCEAGSPVAACAAAWPAQREVLGATGCEGEGGAPASGGLGSSAAGGATSHAGGGGTPAGSGSAPPREAPRAGCDCRGSPAGSAPPAGEGVALVSLLGLTRRRRRVSA